MSRMLMACRFPRSAVVVLAWDVSSLVAVAPTIEGATHVAYGAIVGSFTAWAI
jgi:hypothetical protein